MIQLYIKDYMDSKGIVAKISVLQKYGIPFNTARIILEGRAKNIKLDTLNKLCIALHCTPDSLLNYHNTHQEIHEQHPLNGLTKLPEVNPLELLRYATPEQMEKIKKVMREEG